MVIERVIRRSRREWNKIFRRRRALNRPTHLCFSNARDLRLGFENASPRVRGARDVHPHSPHLTQLYLQHYFDLLGSGWVQVRHAMECRGLEGNRFPAGAIVRADSDGRWLEGRINPTNLKASQKIWRMVDESYCPIDWQLDFKSGFRWSERTWHGDIKFGQISGADIKVPWELARMQHLPQLALAHSAAKINPDGFEPNGFEAAEVYAREARNQILDFIATNPPGFGVNWSCAMDVGIRAANWLVAFDLLRGNEFDWDDECIAVLQDSIYAHGLHIVNHLEWHPELRSNHYLADIAGLLFVAAYLPRTPETDVWLAFAVQELIGEVEYQFHLDGSNFEASTSYHRLSAEMVVYATALVLGLSDDKRAALDEYDHRLWTKHPRLRPAIRSTLDSPFPGWYFERLEKMAEFALHITKPNHQIAQIGDNDSGRFFKIQPAYQTMTVGKAKADYANLAGYDNLPDDATYWMEDHLDHRHLVAAINGLFDRKDFAEFAGKDNLDYYLVSQWSGRAPIASYKKAEELPAAARVRIAGEEPAAWQEWPAQQRQSHEILAPDQLNGAGSLRAALQLYAYPDFGLYIYRSARLYLAIRCGSIGQNGNGGHAHNDQLSIQLNLDGQDLITDPGTYLYTPLPQRRNEYRSVKAHFAPQCDGREPGRLDISLFSLGDEAQAQCLCFDEEQFVGTHRGFGKSIYRRVQILEDQILVTDHLTAEIQSHRHSEVSFISLSPTISAGYGLRRS